MGRRLRRRRRMLQRSDLSKSDLSPRLGCQPTFAVVQGDRSVHVLHELKSFFGCGGVYINRRYDNHKEHLWRYDVRDPSDLSSIIIPFFEASPLRTAKNEDFIKFVAIMRMVQRNFHRHGEGLAAIASIVETMNHRKPSRFLESPEAIRQPTLIDCRS